MQLPISGNRPESVEKELNESLKKLQTSYVDLYLIHGPFSFKEPNVKDADGNLIVENTDHIAIWKVSIYTCVCVCPSSFGHFSQIS